MGDTHLVSFFSTTRDSMPIDGRGSYTNHSVKGERGEWFPASFVRSIAQPAQKEQTAKLQECKAEQIRRETRREENGVLGYV